MARENEQDDSLHGRIGELARSMHGARIGDIDPDELLLEVTQTAVRLLAGVHHAGVTLVDKRRRLTSTAATGETSRTLDRLQEHHQQGPCLSALQQHHTVVVDDYQAETRWPDFITAALAQTSVRSSLTIQLFTDDSELGALNLYSERAGNFTAHIEELALVIAAHAAVGLSGARRGRQFRSGLASRDIIGQAKGIVMERHDINAVDAFRLLVKLSQDRNEPVVQIAEALVDKDHPPTP